MNLQFLLFTFFLGVSLSSVLGQAPPPNPAPAPAPAPAPSAPLLPYKSPCRKDSECDPHTYLEAYKVKCDKMSPFNDTGICGCLGDFYRHFINQTTMKPMPLVNPNAPIGYEEEFNMTEGCRRKYWTGALCPVGSTNCDQRGIWLNSIPNRYGEHVICRNILTEDSLIKEYRCVGKEREALTFGNCGNPVLSIFLDVVEDYKKGAVDCSLPGFTCMNIYKGALYACLPRFEGYESFLCHHDTDCKDPNAVCMQLKDFNPGGFARYFCMCDKERGYIFSAVNGEVKCVSQPEYGQVCQSRLDCTGLTPIYEKYIICDPYLGTSTTVLVRTCQCSRQIFTPNPLTGQPLLVRPRFPLQYFEGAFKETAECAPVVTYTENCNPNYKLDRDLQPVHNCMKRNSVTLGMKLTELRCTETTSEPTCQCAESSEWDRTQQRCTRKYVDLDEECGVPGSGYLPCNPLGHLKCQPILLGATKSRCVCSDLALKDPDGFAYCRLIIRTVGYGEACDDVTDYCNNDEHQLCELGFCVCFTDEEIVDTGTECRFSDPSAAKNRISENKTSEAAPVVVQFRESSVLPLLVCIALQLPWQ